MAEDYDESPDDESPEGYDKIPVALGSEFELRRKWNVDGCLENTIRAHQRNQGEWLKKIIEDTSKFPDVRKSSAWDVLECVLFMVSILLVIGVFAMTKYLFSESNIAAMLPSLSDWIPFLSETPSSLTSGSSIMVILIALPVCAMLRFIWGGWSLNYDLCEHTRLYFDFPVTARRVVVHAVFKNNIATVTIKSWSNMFTPFWWRSEQSYDLTVNVDLDKGPNQQAVNEIGKFFYYASCYQTKKKHKT